MNTGTTLSAINLAEIWLTDLYEFNDKDDYQSGDNG